VARDRARIDGGKVTFLEGYLNRRKALEALGLGK
jgi:hypothetical protein